MDLPKIKDLISCGDVEYLEVLFRQLLRAGFGSPRTFVEGLSSQEALIVGEREGPREDTRQAACGNPYWVYRYARFVDKGPRDDTRLAACGDPYSAYYYARYVDKRFHEETWAAVQGTGWENEYRVRIEGTLGT